VTQPIRVVIVSPALAMMHGLAGALDAAPEIIMVGEAGSSRQALARVPALRPDVVLCGAHLTNPDSPQMCHRLRAAVPGLNVLMIGVFASPELVNAAIHAGASGVVPHTIDLDELVAAIVTTAKGNMVMSASTLHTALHASGKAAVFRSLTQLERELFGLVGEGLSNAEIAERLHLSEGTVRNYVSRMLGKLQLTRRSQVAAMAASMPTQRHTLPGSAPPSDLWRTH